MDEPDDRQDEEKWARLIDGLRRGDDQVLTEFYNRYDGALHLIVRRRLDPAYLRRFDSDDVVQSTLRTFFRRVQSGHLEMLEQRRLWNLLCAIALTKLRERLRFHRRMRRAIQRESRQSTDAGSGAEFPELAAPEDSVTSQAEFAEAFEAILQSLGERDRQILDLRLQGQSNCEVASVLKVSERTIQRSLAQLAEKFEALLPG